MDIKPVEIKVGPYIENILRMGEITKEEMTLHNTKMFNQLTPKIDPKFADFKGVITGTSNSLCKK